MRLQKLTPILSPFLLLLSAGCGGGGGGGASTAMLSGSLSLPAGQASAVLEAEPNNSVDQAHALGTMVAGKTITVLGNISDTSDAFDGFNLRAPARVEVSVSLAFDGANDFDVLVFDPVANQFVERFISTSTPESGAFHAQGSFDLVVSGFMGSGSYTLTIAGSAPADPIAEREPNDAPGEAQYLGELTQDDAAFTLSGTANSATDGVDRFAFAFPEDASLALDLTFPMAGDFDLRVNDVTLDVLSPVLIDQSVSPTDNPETLLVDIDAMTFVEVEVVAAAGSGAYSLVVLPGAPLAPVVAGSGTRNPGSGRIAPLALERRSDKLLGHDVYYGRPSLEAMTGEVLLMPEPNCDLSSLLTRRDCRIAARVPEGVLCVQFDVPTGLSREDALRRTISMARTLGVCEGVRYGELNLMRHPAGEPNDPFYNLQWHYPLIQLPAAWDITTGSTSVITAVIDTGQTAHPDLVGNQIAGFDFIMNPQIAGDGNGLDSDPTDVGDSTGFSPSSFHGTHVAGTIGAVTDNGTGVGGVNWLGKIMHLRALGIGGGTTFDIMNSMLYAARLPNSSNMLPSQRADILNMSLGGGGFSQSVQDAVLDVKATGVSIFAAAGNENSSQPSYPAAYDGVISVSAVDLNADRAPYSNFHESVDIAAPGGNTAVDLNGDGYADGVLSTLPDESTNPLSFTYSFYQGTSMACPHAAGVAGLMRAVNPTLTPNMVASILETTATDLGDPGHDVFFGHGLINAFQAVSMAAGSTATDPVLGLSTVTLGFTATQGSLSVQVSNLGGGLLEVGPLNVTTQTGGNWLSAARVPAATPVTTDTLSLRVEVDRTGLVDGIYQGSIVVNSNSPTTPSKVVQVSLIVSAAASVDIDIFILAVAFSEDGFPLTDENDVPITAAQVVVNPTTGLNYTFSGLAAGNYLIVAGSDENNDNFICAEGDQFCGAFPTIDEPVIINVGPGEIISGLDFTIQDEAGSSVSNTSEPNPFGGYRRL